MRTLTAILALTLTVGCAHRGQNYVPIVDMRTSDPRTLQIDVEDCQAYARKRPDAASAAVVGAVLGAVLMAVMAGGNRSHNPGFWTAAGAATGAAGAANGAQGTQEDIIKRCLAGRGYSVLN